MRVSPQKRLKSYADVCYERAFNPYRVDINRGFRDQGGNPEKVINVFGLPENSSKAAVKILEVIQREMEKETNRPVDKEMKIRAHNNLVGRLIGKAGGTIKKIMEETGCNVFVSK